MNKRLEDAIAPVRWPAWPRKQQEAAEILLITKNRTDVFLSRPSKSRKSSAAVQTAGRCANNAEIRELLYLLTQWIFGLRVAH